MAGDAAAWVGFPEFRRYEATRQEANNAMVALLAGSKLAAHTLQLTTGSSQLLPEIFPGVEHIKYFNLQTDAATELLLNTGHHLGAVAVPYALAVHEDFIMTVLTLLRQLGYPAQAPGKNQDLEKNPISAWNMHEAAFLTLSQSVPAPGSPDIALEHYHLLREMRNAQIHNGGAISSRLTRQVTDMSAVAAASWEDLARRPPMDIVRNSTLEFTTFDIFASFATTKTLGRLINTLVRDRLTTTQWAEICRADYAMLSSKPLRSDRWIRGLLGHAEMFYGTTPITEVDVIAAAVDAGQWTEGRAVVPRRTKRGGSHPRNKGDGHPSDA